MNVYQARSEVTSRMVSAWSETFMGYTTPVEPGTGDEYQLPLTNYDPTGPCPSGWYRRVSPGNVVCLQPT